MPKTLDDVKMFWEKNPLWTGESLYQPGTREFFEEHRQTVIQDCFAGRMDDRVFPSERNRRKVLDLGCGPGHWTIELALKGCRELAAADLTEQALVLTKRRCELYDIHAELSQQNAESLTYPDNSFSHVNCQGVIHHTPDTAACAREIARVLEDGGTACISVYYRNFFLRSWPVLRWPVKFVARHWKLRGRGRENIFSVDKADEIVRIFDGCDNPIGKAYSKKDLKEMLIPYFDIEQVFLHHFPARAIPFRVPTAVHRFLDRCFGFMIYAVLRKRTTKFPPGIM